MSERERAEPDPADEAGPGSEPAGPSDNPGGWKPLLWSFDGGTNFFPTSWKAWAILIGGTLLVVLGANWLGGILGLGG